MKWLIDCDEISLDTKGSTFLTVDDNSSVGSFTSSYSFSSNSSRVSFNGSPEILVSDKDVNSIRNLEIQQTTNNLEDVAVSTDDSKTFNSMNGIKSSNSAQGSATNHNLIHDNATNMLESAKGPVSLLASE